MLDLHRYIIVFVNLKFFNQRMLGGMREDIVLAADACLTISWSVRSTSFSYDEFLVKS